MNTVSLFEHFAGHTMESVYQNHPPELAYEYILGKIDLLYWMGYFTKEEAERFLNIDKTLRYQFER